MPGSNQEPDAHDSLVCDALALRDGSEGRPWLSQEAWGGGAFQVGSRPGYRPGGLTLTGVLLDASPSPPETPCHKKNT